MACIKAETATMAFAILNIVLVSLSTASSLCVLVLWMVRMFTFLEPPVEERVFFDNMGQLGGIFGWITISLLSLVFSSFLVNGIIKRKPQHIKAYYIYGVLKTFFLFLILIIIVASVNFNVDINAVIILVVSLTIYGLILHLLRYTYTKMEIELEQFSHQPLNDKC